MVIVTQLGEEKKIKVRGWCEKHVKFFLPVAAYTREPSVFKHVGSFNVGFVDTLGWKFS